MRYFTSQQNCLNNMKVVDLFCGGGGLSQGLSDAGLDVVAAFDWWQPALDFYNHNIRGHEACQLDLSNIEESVKAINQWKPDIIVGGPPCQDYSSAGKRDENGGRASLTTSYAEIIAQIKPRMFVMENVERAIKTHTYRNALKRFKQAGYDLAVAVLDASLCGAPQARKRIVVVGSREWEMSGLIQIYRDNQAHCPMTIAEYMGDELDIEYYYRHPRSYARRGIFSVHEPSPTIRGVNRPVPSGYPGHPGDVVSVNAPNLRPLTTKERSRIQTFPKEWELIGRKSAVEQTVGNAVPCALGEFVGKAILQFAAKKHATAQVNPDVVSIFNQYEEPRVGDVYELDISKD